MDKKIQSAIDFIDSAWQQEIFDEDKYLAECEYLIAHRDELLFRVFITLPGGLTGNTDKRWDKIKENSTETCTCGNERVILPANIRQDYLASETIINIVPEKQIYLRPIGGNISSAYVLLEVEPDANLLTILLDPLSSAIDMSLFFQGPPAVDLIEVSKQISSAESEPLILSRVDGSLYVPICVIQKVDLDSKTVTIVLDAAVEAFDPKTEKNPHDQI